MNKKKILLTGASGSIGVEMLKHLSLLINEYEITVFDIKNRKSVKELRPYQNCFEIVYGDITNIDDVQKVCRNKDIIVHLAAIIPPLADKYPVLAHNVNAIGTRNLIQNLEQYSPDVFFLYSSSISVYGDRIKEPWIVVSDPLTPSIGDVYAQTKIEAKSIIKESKLNWCIFRLSAIMGKHKLSKLAFHMPLNTFLEIATPEITAKAFIKALKNKNILSKKIYNLGGGAAFRTTYEEFLSTSFNIYGLGKLDFPEHTFAEKNFHCGYYKDSDILESILHYQSGTIEDYYTSLIKITNRSKRTLTQVFRRIIKYLLLRQSEPFKAYKANNIEQKKKFFLMLIFFIFSILYSVNLFSQRTNLSITISNINPSKGNLIVGIYNNANFWLDTGKEFKVINVYAAKSKLEIEITDIPFGTYAITMYQDENLNGKCDMNFLGIPTEKIGFSNNIKPKLFKPTFKYCKFYIFGTKAINISLIRL